MTLAHELGHGVHQVLAAQQGYLMSGTPLTLAETASVFGEMLTFRALLDAETDPKRRRIMLAGKVEDMLNTVVRQIAFYHFETLLHDERRSGELVPERIGEMWLQVQTESLGPAFEFTPEYRVFWAYIPHFIHSPFYVYAYAFGDCLVNALYSVFPVGPSRVPGEVSRHAAGRRDEAAQGTAGAVRSGCVRPGVLARGLDVIAGFIDELEQRIRRDGRVESPGRDRVRSTSSASCAAWRAPPARWAASPRASPGERMFGIKTDGTRTRRTCKTILGGLKGPLMKVAQFLSTVPDALPDGIRRGTRAAAGQRAADGLGLRPPPHGRASWARTGRAVRELRAGGGRRGLARPGASRDPAGRHASRLQAAIPRHAERGGGRSPPVAAGDGDLSPHGQRHRHEEIYKETAHRLREELDYMREAAQMRLYGHHAGGRAAVHVPVPMRGILHEAAADDDLAGRPAADAPARGGPAGRGAQRLSPRRCSAPGTCRSTATA